MGNRFRKSIGRTIVATLILAEAYAQPIVEPHPSAPAQLSQFAFLIGEKTCDGSVENPGQEPIRYEATWTGRYALDGYVIRDEFRIAGAAGQAIYLGDNTRSFHTEKGWMMRWFDALSSDWADLAPADLGGVKLRDDYITFDSWTPENQLIRITFTDITPDRFEWRGVISTDNGQSWTGGVQSLVCAASEEPE